MQSQYPQTKYTTWKRILERLENTEDFSTLDQSDLEHLMWLLKDTKEGYEEDLDGYIEGLLLSIYILNEDLELTLRDKVKELESYFYNQIYLLSWCSDQAIYDLANEYLYRIYVTVMEYHLNRVPLPECPYTIDDLLSTEEDSIYVKMLYLKEDVDKEVLALREQYPIIFK